MANKFMLDSSAWVEYLAGTSSGAKIKEILDNNNVVTSILTIAELSDKFAHDKKDFESSLAFMVSKSNIVEISYEVAKNSGQLKNEVRKHHKNFSLVDAILYLTSQEQNAGLITIDQDFSELKDVIMLK